MHYAKDALSVIYDAADFTVEEFIQEANTVKDPNETILDLHQQLAKSAALSKKFKRKHNTDDIWEFLKTIPA